MAVWLLLERTQIGRRMRAVAADRYMARAVGIPVGRYVTLSLALAGALAGVAGFLLGHQFLVSPTQGGGYMLKAYIAVALGGWGSVPGALVGALAIGVFETVVSTWLGRRLGLRRSLCRGARRAELATARPVWRAGRAARVMRRVLAHPADPAACAGAHRLAAVRPAPGDLDRHLCAAGLGLSARVRPARRPQPGAGRVVRCRRLRHRAHCTSTRRTGLRRGNTGERCGGRSRGGPDPSPSVALLRARHAGACVAGQSRGGECREPDRRCQRPHWFRGRLAARHLLLGSGLDLA